MRVVQCHEGHVCYQVLVSDGGGDGARLVVWELSLYYSSLIISCEYGVVGVRTLTPVDKCYALFTQVFLGVRLLGTFLVQEENERKKILQFVAVAK